MRSNRLSFDLFTKFIFQVKTKKKTLIYGPDYVVMSRNLYDELTRAPDPEYDKGVWFDEASNG